jgi:hypothetical protein
LLSGQKRLINKTKTHFMKKYILSFTGIAVLFLFFSILMITGCQKEISTPGTGGNPNPGVNDNEMVTGGVSGIVVDENDQPVSGVTVTSGANTTTTDRYGSFRFRNISLSKANGTVKVVRNGYFTAYRSFYSVAGRINNVRIKLLPKTNTGNFNAATGGTVSMAGGVKLVMPATAVTDAGGAAYSGQVNVAMTWIDPGSTDLPYVVMGDLRGITTGGEERGLSTYGMIGVEMTNGSGQPLKIATGKTAELTFPIPASLQGNAPATIDLWHFDEATARWKQEGTATKTGNNYVANVSHFSFWNCDAPFPLIDLCMSLVSPNNVPLNNVEVRIKRLVNNTYGYGRTDSMGNLCGKVPKNEALLLEVLDLCNNVVYSQNIGPFSSNTTLPPITVNLPVPNSLVITGTITNCANANVTNGAALIYIAGGNHYTVPVTNGTFTLSLVRCSGGTLNFTVLGVDYIGLQQSVPVGGSGTSGIINVGTIQACGTSSTQYIEFLVDGIPVNFANPPDVFNYTDSVSSPPFSNSASIYAYRQNAGTTLYSSVSYKHNGTVANGLPLNSVFLNGGTGFISQQIITANPTMNLTAYGPPITGFAEGNFAIQMNFGGTTRNVICNFKVRRN